MIAALASALARRSARERALVAVLLLLVLPFAAAFLIGGPLLDRRDAARAERAEAEVTRAWYRTRQAEVAALPRVDPVASARAIAPAGLGGIEDRLIDAGLRDAVSQLANAQGNRVALTFESVAFEALMPWLEGIEAEAGYRVASLTITRTDDPGAVDADLQLEPRP
jgi:type II secretory pathway component PulM